MFKSTNLSSFVIIFNTNLWSFVGKIVELLLPPSKIFKFLSFLKFSQFKNVLFLNYPSKSSDSIPFFSRIFTKISGLYSVIYKLGSYTMYFTYILHSHKCLKFLKLLNIDVLGKSSYWNSKVFQCLCKFWKSVRQVHRAF